MLPNSRKRSGVETFSDQAQALPFGERVRVSSLEPGLPSLSLPFRSLSLILWEGFSVSSLLQVLTADNNPKGAPLRSGSAQAALHKAPLTHPAIGVSNTGLDNENADLILYTNDVLTGENGRRR